MTPRWPNKKATQKRKPPVKQAAPKDPEIITKVVEDPVDDIYQQPPPQPEPRRRRTPLGGLRLKMSVPDHLKRPGYHLQWWHEDDVLEAQDGGYQFIKDDKDLEIGEGPDINQRKGTDSRVSIVVGRREDGSPIRDYLMETKEEWHQEDAAAVHAASQEVIDSMKRGQDPGGQMGVDGRIPLEDFRKGERIKIDSSTR